MAKKKKQKIEDEFDDSEEEEDEEDFPAPTPTIQSDNKMTEIEFHEHKLEQLKKVESKKNLIEDFPVWKEEIEKELAQIQAYLKKIHPVIQLHNRKFKELQEAKK